MLEVSKDICYLPVILIQQLRRPRSVEESTKEMEEFVLTIKVEVLFAQKTVSLMLVTDIVT